MSEPKIPPGHWTAEAVRQFNQGYIPTTISTRRVLVCVNCGKEAMSADCCLFRVDDAIEAEYADVTPERQQAPPTDGGREE